VLFESWATDELNFDFNNSCDLLGYSLFYLDLALDPLLPHSPVLSWPAWPGSAYSAEYLDSSGAPAWQPLPGTILYQNSRAAVQDDHPADTRVYRVRSDP